MSNASEEFTPPPTPGGRRPWAVWLLVAVVLAGAAYFAYALPKARAQRSAVAAIEALGGHVTYRNPTAAKSGLRAVLGRDMFDPVYEVFLKDTKATDADLRPLASLGSLETLDLTNAAITDAALPELEKLASLRRIYVTGTQISPDKDHQLRAAIPGLDLIR
jgi:hypothetical protein